MTEWNLSDPDEPRVYYDLSEWDFEQQAELASSLAEVDITHRLRGPHALRHLRTGVGGHQHLLADGVRLPAGVQVVEPAVSREGDGHHPRHGPRLSPQRPARPESGEVG